MATVAVEPRNLLLAQSSGVKAHTPAFSVAALMTSDVLAASLAWAIAGRLGSLAGWTHGLMPYHHYLPVSVVIVCAYAFCRLYPGFGLTAIREFRAIVTTILIIYANLGFLSFIEYSGDGRYSVVLAGAAALSVALLMSFRHLVRSALARLGWWGTQAIVIGTPRGIAGFLSLLRGDNANGIRVIGALTDWADQPFIEGVPVLGGINAAADVAKKTGAPLAIVTPPETNGPAFDELVRTCGKYFPNLILVPKMLSTSTLWVEARSIGNQLTLEVRQNLLMRGPRLCKRVVDLAVALAAGLMLLPALCIIALAVKLSSRGPVFYGQIRIGRHRRLFRAWKFRTMVPDASAVLATYLANNPELREEWERDQKLRNDPRVTAIGRFLRRTSLDELPQLWNVIRGEMSLVGPRPIVASEVERYADAFDEYTRVLPGITGLWQVSGRSDTTYAQRVQLDTYYTHNWSPWLDLYLILRTFGVLVSGRGAY